MSSKSTVLPPPAAAIPVSSSKKSDAAPVASKGKAAPAAEAKEAPAKEELDVSNPDTTVIDMDILGQILEMDEPDEESFSKPLVQEYFGQADATLQDMDAKIKEGLSKDALQYLSEKGHFLKGSSAALGVIQVRDSCETIQNLGKSKNASGSADIKEEEAWKQIEELIPTVKDQHIKATRWLEVLCHL